MKIKRYWMIAMLVLVAMMLSSGAALADGTITKTWAFGDGGWAGWSAPAGQVVTGGGFTATGPVSVSAPGTPGSVWAHYTYGANEYGWVVRDAVDGASNTITMTFTYADAPAGYEVIISPALNFSDTGWGGWSVPDGKVVIGGGYQLSAGSAAFSGPATPDSVWAHYTYGANEYGWVVQGAADGLSSPGSYVYAIGQNAASVPEPATMLLFGLGLLGLAGLRRKLKK